MMLKTYETLDEVRAGLLYECENAVSDLFVSICQPREDAARHQVLADVVGPDEFTIRIGPELAARIRELGGR